MSKDVYFMKQTISNACGTIALLHALGNNLDRVSLAPDSFLGRFFEATKGMSPEEVGRYLERPPEGAPDIEQAHAAAAMQGQTSAPNPDEVVDLHFVALVNVGDTLYGEWGACGVRFTEDAVGALGACGGEDWTPGGYVQSWTGGRQRRSTTARQRRERCCSMRRRW